MIFSSLKQYILELSLYPYTVFVCVFICSAICHCVYRNTTVDSTGFFHRDIWIVWKFFSIIHCTKGDKHATYFEHVQMESTGQGPEWDFWVDEWKHVELYKYWRFSSLEGVPFTPTTDERHLPTASKKEVLSNWLSPDLKGEKTSHYAYFCCLVFYFFS